MEAKEFRVGNIIDQGVIKNLLEKDAHLGYGKTINYKDIKPTIITKEHLINFEFEYVGDLYDCHLYKKGIVTVSVIRDIITFSLKRDSKSSYIPLKEVKYLHKLQNLFFALTDDELEFKHKV